MSGYSLYNKREHGKTTHLGRPNYVITANLTDALLGEVLYKMDCSHGIFIFYIYLIFVCLCMLTEAYNNQGNDEIIQV